MKKKLFVPIALLFCVIGIYFGIQQHTPTPALNNTVDDFFHQSMQDVSGKTTALSQWKGQPLIINFWATWCPPCVQEIPELNALQTEINAQKIHILGIGIDSHDNITQFAQKHNITYPLYIAGTNGTMLLRQFGNQANGLPFTVLINKNGEIKQVYLGSIPFDKLRKDLALLTT